MKEIIKIVQENEDWLMSQVLMYAKRQDYTKYTSTLAEAWRLSIKGLSEALCKAIQTFDFPPEIGPDDDLINDPITSFGILEAQKHRSRGVTLTMFLGLMKYYRQSYLDLVKKEHEDIADVDQSILYIHRFFDKIELGFIQEWTELKEKDKLLELKETNRKITNEKNKFLTIFESIKDPVIFYTDALQIENLNAAAMKVLFGRSGTARYYETGPDHIVIDWLEEEVNTFLDQSEEESSFEKMVTTPDGDRTFIIQFKKMMDVSETNAGVSVLLSDITEKKQIIKQLEEQQEHLWEIVNERTKDLQKEIFEGKIKSKQLKHINMALQTLSACNTSLIRSSSEEELFVRICQIIVDNDLFMSSWVAYRNDAGDYICRASASSPNHEIDNELIDEICFFLSKDQSILEIPDIRAHNCGESANHRNESLKKLLRRVYDSKSLFLPLKGGNEILGVISITSDVPEAFERKQMDLLLEMSEDLSYGILAHRLREKEQRSQRELQEKKEELEQVNIQLVRLHRVKDEMMANVSHELKTPLNKTMGLLGLMRDGLYESEEEKTEFIKLAYESCAQLDAMITSLLDLSRLESGNFDLRIRDVDLVGVLSSLMEQYTEQAQKKGIKLYYTPPDCELTVYCDEVLLHKVCSNILSNAVKFTHKGSIQINVHEDHDNAIITVFDTGIGIESESEPNLYEPFNQIDGTTTRKFGGIGIGLSISKIIMELMSGNIKIFSEGIGKGTKVEIIVPTSR